VRVVVGKERRRWIAPPLVTEWLFNRRDRKEHREEKNTKDQTPNTKETPSFKFQKHRHTRLDLELGI
jgi:hypothetical protein